MSLSHAQQFKRPHVLQRFSNGRKRGVAKNVLYPKDKIAIWAANTHISRQKNVGARPQWMGEWLSSHYKELYYSIAFQKGSLTTGEKLHPGFSVQFTPGQPQFNAIVLLKRSGKISPGEWETPCD